MDPTPAATLRFTVSEDDTAIAVGSGSLPVLGTPRLLAWLEAAMCAAIDPTLPDGSTSVGTRVELEHVAASAVGQQAEVSAAAAYVDGRLHRFAVAARNVGAGDAAGKVVATVATGKGADGIAWDPKRKVALVSAGGDGVLNVVAVDRGKPALVQTLPTMRGARTIGIDERTGQVFLPSAEYAAPAGGGRAAMTPGSFKLLVVSP